MAISTLQQALGGFNSQVSESVEKVKDYAGTRLLMTVETVPLEKCFAEKFPGPSVKTGCLWNV